MEKEKLTISLITDFMNREEDLGFVPKKYAERFKWYMQTYVTEETNKHGR